MAIQTRCPNCDASYNLAEAQRGKKVQCRKCSKAFVVGGDAAPKAAAPAAAAKSGKIRKDALQPPPRPTPSPPLQALPVRRDRDHDDDYEDDYEDDRNDRDDRDEPEEKAGMSGGIKVLIGVCVLLVIVLGLGATAFGIWWWMRNSANGVPTPPVAGSGNPNAPNGGQQGGNVVGAAPEEPPKNVTDAIVWINTANTADRKNQAAEWLANAPVDEAQRKKVDDLMEKLALDPMTHRSAIKVLARWAGPENIQTLRDVVQKDAFLGLDSAAGEAAEGLIHLQADGIADIFASRLPDLGAHENAKKYLSELGADKAEAAVLPFVNSKNDWARNDAQSLLRQFGTKSEAIFDQSVKDLRRPGFSLHAAEYVGQQTVDPARQADVAKALEAALGDDDAKPAAARALVTWATKDQVPALIVEMDHKDTTTGFGRGREAGTFQPCLDALAQLKDPQGAEAVARHWKDPTAGRPEKDKIFNALQKMGKVAEKTVLAYVNDPDQDVAADAKRLISQYGSGGDAVLDATLADLNAADGRQRKTACDALAKMTVVPDSQAKVARALEKLLTDRDEGGNDVTLAAIKALALWGDKDTGKALALIIQNKDHRHWQEAVDLAVQRKDEAAVVPLILLTVPKKDFFKGDAALRALAQLGPVVETAVDNIAADPNETAASRLNALRLLALPDIGTAKSVPVVQNATMDPNLKAVATQVLAVLKKR